MNPLRLTLLHAYIFRPALIILLLTACKDKPQGGYDGERSDCYYIRTGCRHFRCRDFGPKIGRYGRPFVEESYYSYRQTSAYPYTGWLLYYGYQSGDLNLDQYTRLPDLACSKRRRLIIKGE